MARARARACVSLYDYHDPGIDTMSSLKRHVTARRSRTFDWIYHSKMQLDCNRVMANTK